MELLPKCPNCGADLEQDDVLDMDYDDDEIDLFCIGDCPKCGKSYQWNRTATALDWTIKNLKET